MRWQHCCVLWPVIIIISEHHYQGERCSRVLALPVVVFVNVIVGLLCAVWAGGKWNGMGMATGRGRKTTNLGYMAIFIVLRLFNINISAWARTNSLRNVHVYLLTTGLSKKYSNVQIEKHRISNSQTQNPTENKNNKKKKEFISKANKTQKTCRNPRPALCLPPTTKIHTVYCIFRGPMTGTTTIAITLLDRQQQYTHTFTGNRTQGNNMAYRIFLSAAYQAVIVAVVPNLWCCSKQRIHYLLVGIRRWITEKLLLQRRFQNATTPCSQRFQNDTMHGTQIKRRQKYFCCCCCCSDRRLT